MKRPSPPYHGFTLIEILVTTALVAILCLILVQTTGALTRATGLSNQGIEASNQARAAFDLLGMDLAGAVIRPDADFLLDSRASTGEDQLRFLANVASADPAGQGGFSNRQISLVAYRIGPNPFKTDENCLLRAARAVSWSDSGLMGVDPATDLPISLQSSGYPITINADDFDVVAPGVLRLVTGYQLYPDDQPATLADGTQIPNARGQVVYSPPLRSATAPGSAYVDTRRIAALVVGLVTIDPARLKLTNAAQREALAGAFTATPAAGEMPVARWMRDTAKLSTLPESAPLPVRQSVRVFQRSFPLSPFTGTLHEE